MNEHTPLEKYRKDIARCVKCGSCSTVCPTYRHERDESFSARGRMALVKAVLDGRFPASAVYRDRLASCTTCLACEDACPGKVPVTRIIQAAREQAVHEAGIGVIKSVIAEVVKHPALFSAVAWLAPVALHYAKGQGASSRGQVASSKGQGDKGHSSEFRVQRSTKQRSRGKVVFFPGCAVDHFQQDIGTATIAVLERLGYEVIVPRGMKCCGRPLLSLGDRRGAETLAAHNATVLAKTDAIAIVTACASCGLTLKHDYPGLLRPGRPFPVVLDIHECIADKLEGMELSPVHKTVTWHDPCHLSRGQGSANNARDILRAIPGISLVEMRDADRCCGFGGLMRLSHRGLSDGIAAVKAANIVLTSADIVATGCPGCMMQISEALRRKDSDVQVLHTVQVLEQAMRPVDCELRDAEMAGVSNK